MQDLENMLLNEQWDRASALATELLIRHPGDSRVLFLLARVQHFSGNDLDAVETLQEIDLSDPDFGLSSRAQAAGWLAQRGMPIEAKRLYEEAMSAYPNNELLLHTAAKFYNSVGWRYRANDILVDLLGRALATERELRAMHDVTNSFAATQHSHAAPFDGVQGPLSAALGCIHRREPDAAIAEIQRLDSVDGFQNDPLACSILAAAHAERQDYEQMAIAIRRGGPRVDQFPLYWRALGDFHRQEGRVEFGLDCYVQALRLDSTSEIVHERLMAVLLQSDRPAEAVQFDNRRELLASAGQCLAAIGPGQPDDAEALSDLVGDLESAGYPLQAARWAEIALQRHPQMADPAVVRTHIQRLRSIPEDDIDERQFCGLTQPLTQLPEAVERVGQLEQAVLETPNSSMTRLAPLDQPAALVDLTDRWQLNHQYRPAAVTKERNFQIYEALGGGIAALDFNLDGRLDLYTAQAGGTPPDGPSQWSDQLWIQRDEKYQAVTEAAGVAEDRYTAGVTSGDLNADGWPDLLIGNLGSNRILINQGDGTFIDQTHRYGWSDEADDYTMGLAIADVDRDAVADIVEVNYVNDPSMYQPVRIGPDGVFTVLQGPLMFDSNPDCIWHQSDDGILSRRQLGDHHGNRAAFQVNALDESARPGLGLIVTDIDQRPGIEMFIANDARPNQLWVSREDAWVDVATISGTSVSGRGEASACMGVALDDFDLSGREDLLITNWYDEWNNLFSQTAPLQFVDIAPRVGLDQLSQRTVGFGCQSLDYNNDGWPDVLIVNGHVDDMEVRGTRFRMPPQLLVNRGGTFELARHQTTTEATAAYWQGDHVGRCLIKGDVDRDGRVDAVVADLLEPVRLLLNETPTDGHWIQLETVGVTCDRNAIGAVVTVRQGENQWTRSVATGDGYQGRNEAALHFGLGPADSDAEVEIHWPDGMTQTFDRVPCDKRSLLIQGQNDPWVRH